MFSVLENIKNKLFSFSPLQTNEPNTINTISNIINNDDNNSLIEDVIENADPAISDEEAIQTTIYDKHPYIVTNLVNTMSEEYHYLHGEQLSQSYDFCLNATQMLKIHICMVGIDFTCNFDGEHLPFIRFLTEYLNDTIIFPQCILNCPINKEDELDVENTNSQMDIYFHNECMKKILEFFALEGHMPKDTDMGQKLHTLYRGYKEIGNNEIVAVFDITNMLTIPLRTSKNTAWIVVDDFIQNILPFSNTILHFFETNQYMNEIRDPNNNIVETPKSLYLYDIQHNTPMLKSEKSPWLEPRSHHLSYGNFYYMIQNTGLSTLSVNRYRKCIVFMKNYANFIPIQETPMEMNNDLMDQSTLEGSFHSDETIEDAESEDINTDEYVRSPRHSFTDENINDTLPFISLILFMNKDIPIYCVKTESIFCEL